jgi:uncharacterized membrane protein
MMRSTWISHAPAMRQARAERRRVVLVGLAFFVASWLACLAIVFAVAGIIWLISSLFHSIY